MTGYAELQVTTNFSFLRGAAHPEELVETAAALGYRAIAVTDRNTLAGVVRAHVAARNVREMGHDIRVLVGARLDLEDGPSLLCLPTDRAAYGRLSRLLTLGKRRSDKGTCTLRRADLLAPIESGEAESAEAEGAKAEDGTASGVRYLDGQVLIVVPPERFGDENGEGGTAGIDPGFEVAVAGWVRAAPGACFLAASILYRGDDEARLRRLAEVAARTGAPLVATGDIAYHVPERRPLADVLACIREHVTIDDAGFRLDANAERYAKPPVEIARLFRAVPEAVARTVEIASRCRFSLDELRYEYPEELTSEGRGVDEELEVLTFAGAAERWPEGIPPGVVVQLRYELELIERLGYAPYFLTVHDMVRFARSRGILCQGRGSAANSAVCYALGITAVDPSRSDLLFERFVSEERGEPPDIDVDFEHERREEVIQYVYAKYGRERAGLAATVISYRARSAVREVGRAMGLSGDVVGALAGQVWGWHGEGVKDAQVREIGLDPADPRLRQALDLTRQLIGFPRHLSQHVGGFVMTRDRLDALVPIENAAMAERTVIEWDKDDLDALGILKVDVLALGMLSCVRKGFDLLRRHHGVDLSLATVPAEDPAVYDMLCRGDSLGVFQVESRAQMAMLPRLKPRAFYDLVIEVAIVRPGPIQGNMVHPYLRRRNGDEPVEFPSEELRQVLGKTLGVPLFQEQAMKIAIVAAGFTPSEADKLRRAMATFRKTGSIGVFHAKMVEGMAARGYDRDFAERCFRQIEGFGNYGFPESHAASFALLVYVSSWMKCHYPAAFAAALLNAQPMGFYAPAQIVRDVREHGVSVRPPDVNHGGWDCDLEPDPKSRGGVALRLGLRQIKGFREEDAEILLACRGAGYRDPGDLWRRAGLDPAALERLARGDAFGSCGLSRREVFWAVRGLARNPTGVIVGGREGPGADVGVGADAGAGAGVGASGREGLPLFAAAERRLAEGATEGAIEGVVAAWLREAPVRLPTAPLGEEVVDDYASLRLSLKAHPMALLRGRLTEQEDGKLRALSPCSVLEEARAGRRLRLAGLVLVRQRPGTAKGVIFITLEDETGIANLVVWPDMFEAHRRVVLSAKLLGVTGRVQREGRVVHVVVEALEDLTPGLAALTDGTLSHEAVMDGFERSVAHADEVRRPTRDQRDTSKRRAQSPSLPPPLPPPATANRPGSVSSTKPMGAHPRTMKPDLRVVSRDFH